MKSSLANVDDCISISIADLRRQSVIEEGAKKSGIMEWQNGDETLARIYFKSNLNTDTPTLSVQYTINETDHHDYTIALSRTAMHFGGYRYWFHCPETDKRVTRIYYSPEDGRFLSRHAFDVLYPSQRQTDFDRAIAMRNKYAAKLEGLPETKPKGMHYTTFIKLYYKYKHYNDLALELMAGRFGKYQDKVV